jgi:hypothetical protein
MSKKKWRRVRLEDLADTEKQKEILKLIAQANDQAPDSPQRAQEAPETAQDGR